MTVGVTLREDARLEESKVVRLRRATVPVSPRPHRVRAVSGKVIQPRAITDEAVG